MLAVALRRRHVDPFRDDAGVVGRHLDRPGVVGPQHLEERARADAADGEFLRAVKEGASAHAAMHIEVEKIEQLLREVGCFLAHRCSLLCAPRHRLPHVYQGLARQALTRDRERRHRKRVEGRVTRRQASALSAPSFAFEARRLLTKVWLRNKVALPRAGQVVEVPLVVLDDSGKAGFRLKDQFLGQRRGAEFPPLGRLEDVAQ